MEADLNAIKNSALRSAFEAFSDGVAVFDKASRLVTFNQEYLDMFPMIADLIKPGAHWDDMLRACVERGQILDPFDDVEGFMNRARLHRSQFNDEILAHHADGKVYQVRFAPSEAGGCVVMRRDVTEVISEENRVKDSQVLLATVLGASPTAIVMARLSDSRVIYRSEEAREIFGDTTFATAHYANTEDRLAYVKELEKTGRIDDYRLTIKRKDGSEFEATSSGRIVEFAGETCVVSALTDLTSQLEHDALVRYMVESCPAPIQMINVETGEILFNSPETLTLFGNVETAVSFYVDPKNRQAFVGKLRENGTVHEFKTQFYNSKGEVFWGAVSANLLWYNGVEVIVSHTRDMTGQLEIEAELNAQRDLMFQNEKMSAMGELLAGVAHELNNPLSVVVGHSLMLREDTQDEGMLRQIQKISDAAERSAKIVKTFLTLARQQPAKFEPVDINDVITTATDVARYGDLAKNIEIECDLSQTLPACHADADQITQVVLNLMLNAEHAIKESGIGDRIVVRTGINTKKDVVLVSVENNGPSLPKSQHSRVFEPFFTTKDVGSGTGIGLTLSHQILRSHGGQITLDKSFSSGVRFLIEIPCGGELPVGKAEVESLVDGSEKASRVLIVDDEVDVADMNAEVLSRAGYEVAVANTAQHGLELIQMNTYDLIISDLNMPEIDGRGLYETVKKNFPTMTRRIGFVTGDTMGKASQTFLKEADRPYLEKPASPMELRNFVESLLCETRGVS